jgi:hypothetical protein
MKRVSNELDRMRLLEELGVPAVAALQSDAIVVVEGTTDRERLTAMLPLEFGRVFTLVARSGDAVETVVRMLNETAVGIPHVGVRDRDFMSDTEVAELKAALPNLFIWSGRSIENEILKPNLISATLNRTFGHSTTESEVTDRLRTLAAPEREDVVAQYVHFALRRQHRYTKKEGTPIERRRHYLEEQVRVATAQLETFDDVVSTTRQSIEARWDAEFLSLADGKRLLSEFTETSGFKSRTDFLAALTHTMHTKEDLFPEGLSRLRAMLAAAFVNATSGGGT